MWGFGDNKEKDTSKHPQKKLKGGEQTTPEAIKKARDVRGGSALKSRMCKAFPNSKGCK